VPWKGFRVSRNSAGRSHSPFRAVWAALLVSLVGSLLSTSISASAAVVESGYAYQVQTVYFSHGSSYAFLYVPCPSGQLAVASGALSGQPNGYLMSGTVTHAGTGSFATAFGYDLRQYQVTAQCVAASRLQGNVVASNVLRDHTVGGGDYVRRVSCPTGYLAYGGGGVLEQSGVYLREGLRTFASYPYGTSTWIYGGNGALGDASLTVETHCVPRAKLGTIRTVYQHVSGAAAWTASGKTVTASPRCPAGFFAFAGGAWWHSDTSSTAANLGVFSVSTMAVDTRGWTAVGKTWYPHTQLTVQVSCTDRLG
jgi:hypothetical protein